MISDNKVEACLAVLDSTDDELGRLWGRVKATEHLIKQYKAQAFLASTGTVAEREAKAQTDPQVARAQNDYENAEAEYRTIWARRETARTYLDVWRTQAANNRRGGV